MVTFLFISDNVGNIGKLLKARSILMVEFSIAPNF